MFCTNWSNVFQCLDKVDLSSKQHESTYKSYKTLAREFEFLMSYKLIYQRSILKFIFNEHDIR